MLGEAGLLPMEGAALASTIHTRCWDFVAELARPEPLTRLLSFCCSPPLPSAGVSIVMDRERQQNDSLANG